MELQVIPNPNSIQDQTEFHQSGDVSNQVEDSDRLYMDHKYRKAGKRIYSLFMLVFVTLSMTAAVLIIYFTSPKPSTTCVSAFERTMKSSLVSSSKPRSVAIGDLNNDHLPDIVVANYGINTIGIFISQGNGNFNEQITYFTGPNSLPYSIVIADFNNDSYLDIGVANYGLNNIGIFLGYGNGSFGSFITISLGPSRPIVVTAADFNQDDQVDIAVVNDGTNSIGILLGYGNASFSNYQTYSTGYDSLPSSLVVGDFNSDSHLDIAVANYGADSIGIFLGTGNGSFQNQLAYSTLVGSNPSSIATGDLNNDNYLDIVISNNGTGNLEIFFGRGNGTFPERKTYSTGRNSYPQYVSVGDLNKDNHLDIVVVDSINDQIHLIQGYGNGNFDAIATYDGISESAPCCVGLADLNKNNQTDIVVVNYGMSNILILMDYFVVPSVRKTILFSHLSRRVASVAVSDFNDDHILDIVFSFADIVYVFIGLGDGTFENTHFPLNFVSALQYIYVGDVNDDNRTDIIAADTRINTVDILLGHGNESFSPALTYSTGNNSQPCWLGLGDFNGDNILDIVSVNSGSKSVGILLGYGNGSFAPVIIHSMKSAFNPRSVGVGYFDSDSHLDLAVSDNGNRMTIFLGFGNGSFYIKTTFDAGGVSLLFSLALADFNNDNHLDIVVADTYGNQINIFPGYGNGTFASKRSYSTGTNSQPYYVIVNDFNNDNTSDIATGNSGTDEILIFYGYGNGSFQLERNYSIGGGSAPNGIAAADLDNDKQLEIVVALFGTRQVAVLTQYYAAKFRITTTFATGSAPQPSFVAVGKFDNEHKSLIVTANSGTNNLDVLFTSNSGGLDTEIIYSTSNNSQPHYVLTCDINNDKRLDVVSVNSKSNSIGVILGDASGRFENQIIYSTGDSSKPYAAASSDLNNDTRLDLIIANAGTDEIGIFYGFHFTSFQPYTSYSHHASLTPYGIVVSDFNSDSYLDIAVTFPDNDSIGILFGYSNGSFSDMTTFFTGTNSTPAYLGVGDFNQDNQTDMLIINFINNSISIILGYGNGSFGDIMRYSLGEGRDAANAAVGDLNNDTRLDIVVANYASNNIGVFLGYGNGSFSNVQLYSTGDSSHPRSVVAADINDDNRLDILVTNQDDDSIGIFFGYGNGTFQEQVPLWTGFHSQPNWLCLGDFNRDNQLDIAVALWNANSVLILFGPVNESFADNATYFVGDGSLPVFICTGDFNQDTYLDIAVVTRGTNSIVILFGLGDGTFLQGKSYSTGINSSPFAMVVGDFNNDFRLDIAVTNTVSNNTVVFLANGNEPFGSVTRISADQGSQPHSVAIGDCNNDGQMDIIVANYGTNNVGVFLGYPNRVFGTMKTYSTGTDSSPYSLAVADLNNDQHLDVVVTNSHSDNIMIMFGTGNGSFIDKTIYSTGDRSRPYQIVIHDMNNDRLLDVIVANSGTSNIFLLYGLGNGTFGNASSYALGYGYEPYSIAVSDLNEDGKMDIAVACHSTDHVEILLRTC